MKRYKNKLINKRFSFLLVILIAMFLFNISITLASESSEEETLETKYSYSISVESKSLKVKDFNELYTSIINNKDIESYTIMLNGKLTNIIEMPSNSVALKLPDERIAMKYSNEDVGILPNGSNVIFYNDEPVVSIPDQSAVLKVSEVAVFPMENLTKTAIFDQSIGELDSYKVKIVFNELNNKILSDNIANYSVDWGDGSSEIYAAETTIISHVYTKSGSYSLTVNVNDDFGFTHHLEQSYRVKYEGHLLHTFFLLEKNKEPVAVVSSTSMSVLAMGLIAFTETGKYKFLALLPLLIPMYTRIQKEDVLDQFVRGQIYGYIKTNPGVHYNQIRRGIDIKNGTLSYHLRVLEKTELIKSRREGLRYRAFYPISMKFPKVERFRLTELQISILDVINKNSGIDQKEIANKLDKKPQTINYNIKVLEQAGLIEVRKLGRRTGCYPKENIDYSDKPAE
ncbi:MAG: helix-turn-helix domain-containing protein [Thermoplasmatales archaeon]|nr:MAG: helix-turn-helix domain-containing protein [Thermoplasmatales archaeon]